MGYPPLHMGAFYDTVCSSLYDSGTVNYSLLFDIILPAEPLNTAGSVYQLLLTCKEGVAG